MEKNAWLFNIAWNPSKPNTIELRQTLKNMAARLLQGPIQLEDTYYSEKETEDMAFQILDLLDFMDRHFRKLRKGD